MTRSTEHSLVLKAAKEDAEGCLNGSKLLLFLCLVVFAIHWKYLYNCIEGPIPITAEMAESPDIRDHVSVAGPFMDSGVKTETAIRIKRTRIAFENEYKMADLNGKKLLVLLETGPRPSRISGTLETLPLEVQESLGDRTAEFYPSLVRARTSYFWDTNIFMLAAMFLFPLAFLLWFIFRIKAGDVTKVGAIKALAAYGASPLRVVEQIDAELASPRAAHFTGLHLGPNWIVGTKPALGIANLQDVATVWLDVEVKKNGNVETQTPYLGLTKADGKECMRTRLEEAETPAIMAKARDMYGSKVKS